MIITSNDPKKMEKILRYNKISKSFKQSINGNTILEIPDDGSMCSRIVLNPMDLLNIDDVYCFYIRFEDDKYDGSDEQIRRFRDIARAVYKVLGSKDLDYIEYNEDEPGAFELWFKGYPDNIELPLISIPII